MAVVKGPQVVSTVLVRALYINAAPTDGTSGTGAGVSEPGTLAIDSTNFEIYMNAGTTASPVWKKFNKALYEGIYSGAGAPTDGAAGVGTQAGVAEIGSLYLDKTNGNAYINAGTKASPVWKLITRAA